MDYSPRKPEAECMWEVEGEQYPPNTAPRIMAGGATYTPASWLIYCGTCGDVWAKRVMLKPPFPTSSEHFWARRSTCRKCGGGKLWSKCDETWNLSLPYGVLKRELLLIGDRANENEV